MGKKSKVLKRSVSITLPFTADRYSFSDWFDSQVRRVKVFVST